MLRAEYAKILLLTSTPGEPVLRSATGSSGELLMRVFALLVRRQPVGDVSTFDETGDELLVEVAARMRRTVRPSDACAARRRQCAVLPENADATIARRTAERLGDALGVAFCVSNRAVNVTPPSALP